MATPPEEPFITADDAMFELDRAVHGMGGDEGGFIGRMEGEEARKLATYLFSGPDGLPEELKQFFEFPEEK